jgi:hypothetical protein
VSPARREEGSRKKSHLKMTRAEEKGTVVEEQSSLLKVRVLV